MKRWALTLSEPTGDLWSRPNVGYSRADLEKVRMIWMRKHAHMLLDMIPDQGLDEAYQSLKEMYEFYASRPETTWSYPPVRRRASVDIAASYDRPEFPILED